MLMQIHFCRACVKDLRARSESKFQAWLAICELYYQRGTALLVPYSSTFFPIIHYLEKRGYVISTEFPDPLSKKDALWLEPQAYIIEGFNITTCTFCAKKCVHFDN